MNFVPNTSLNMNTDTPLNPTIYLDYDIATLARLWSIAVRSGIRKRKAGRRR